MTEMKEQMEIDRMIAVARSLGWNLETASREGDKLEITISKPKAIAKEILEK